MNQEIQEDSCDMKYYDFTVCITQWLPHQTLEKDIIKWLTIWRHYLQPHVTFTRPFWNSSSTTSLSIGSIPLWCIPRPLFNVFSICNTWRKQNSSTLSNVKKDTKRMWSNKSHATRTIQVCQIVHWVFLYNIPVNCQIDFVNDSKRKWRRGINLKFLLHCFEIDATLHLMPEGLESGDVIWMLFFDDTVTRVIRGMKYGKRLHGLYCVHIIDRFYNN